MNIAGRGVRAVATRWGVTEGQVYTAIIGLIVALAAAVGGIPPTLADRPTVVDDTGSLTRPRSTAAAEDADDPVVDDAYVPLVLDEPSGDFSAGPNTSSPFSSTVPAAPERLAVGAFRVLASVPEPGAPQGVVVGPDGRVLVATNNGDGRGRDGRPVLFVFDDEGELAQRLTVVAVASGGGIHDLVLPRGGDGDVVYGLASQPAAVLRIDVARRSVTTYAAIPNLPTCASTVTREPCELSPVDNAPTPVAAALDAGGALIVADAAQAVLWRVAPDRSVSVFFKAPEFVSLDGLSGLAFAGTTLYVTVAESPADGQRGVVYRLRDNTLTQVALTANGTLPRGLAVSRAGRLYVTLAGTGQVLVLDDKGATVKTLPTDAASAFDTPVRVAFSRIGLLVVEQAPTRPTAGRVVELGVDDEGRT